MTAQQVTYEITMDLSRFIAALDQATADMAALTLAFKAADPLRADREWARYYVRGAMDPAYTDPAARDRRVKHLTRTGHPSAAAALLRGWVTHREAM